VVLGYIGFLPARAGSERVKNKNTRPFAGLDGGLLELKLRQLHKVGRLDEIIVSSNDPIVLDYARQFAAEVDDRVVALERPDQYGVSATSMERFIADYIAHLRDNGTIFWTHVTHPFATSRIYEEAIDAYEQALTEGYDSLVSATRIQKFLWRDGRPFNYDNSAEKWPRSQDLPPVWEINHAIYIMPFEVMRSAGDRITDKSCFFPMEEGASMDIDWEDQFHLMDEIAQARIARGLSLI
jgi:CMP-N-acetylneuraminic acid synthetase